MDAPPGMVGILGYFLNVVIVSFMSWVPIPMVQPESPPDQRPCEVPMNPSILGAAPLNVMSYVSAGSMWRLYTAGNPRSSLGPSQASEAVQVHFHAFRRTAWKLRPRMYTQ